MLFAGQIRPFKVSLAKSMSPTAQKLKQISNLALHSPISIHMPQKETSMKPNIIFLKYKLCNLLIGSSKILKTRHNNFNRNQQTT